MIQMVTSRPIPLKNFLNNFSHFFSKKLFISFCFYFSGLFVEMKHTNISSISNKIPDSHYQNLQYFISDAKWNPCALNNHRLALLNDNSATKPTSRGVIVIDDTGCKKWGQHFQGVANQYYGTEHIITNSHNVVFSAYCDDKKSYPINFFPYLVEKDTLCISGDKIFKSKITLADELVDDVIAKDIPHCDVIFDNWYFASELIYLLNLKKQHWISEAESNRLISFKGKWTKADDLVKVIPSIKFNRKVTFSNAKGKERSFLVYGFKTKIHNLEGDYYVVIAVGKWDSKDPKKVHVFVTSHLTLDPEVIVKRYALRWKIESIFRDLKDNLAFDHYQVRSIDAISKHWYICVLAHSFLLWGKATGSFQHRSNRTIRNLNDVLKTLRALISDESFNWISSHRTEYSNHIGLKAA